jgi:peroxiredoxin
MAQSLTRKLDAGMPFPDFTVQALDASPASIKATLGGSWSVLLFYRGHW